MTTTTIFIVLIPFLAVLLLGVNFLLAPHNPYEEKDSAFECGYHSFLGQTRIQFSISFYVFAMLFLLFDLEIVLMYPYTVSSYNNDSAGLTIMLIFSVVVTLGLVFELGKEALSLESKQTITNTDTDDQKSGLVEFYSLILIPHYNKNGRETNNKDLTFYTQYSSMVQTCIGFVSLLSVLYLGI